MSDEKLTPLIIHLFGHRLNDLTVNDALLALEFLHGTSVPLEAMGCPERHAKIAKHFIEMRTPHL